MKKIYDEINDILLNYEGDKAAAFVDCLDSAIEKYNLTDEQLEELNDYFDTEFNK